MSATHPFRCCGLFEVIDPDGDGESDRALCGDCDGYFEDPTHDGFIPLGVLNTDDLEDVL